MKTKVQKINKTKTSRKERAANTRKKFIEATIECLADLGYARMSTNDVVRKTGLSRGALAHHFPSKAYLVAESAAYLINMRIKYTIQKFEALSKENHDLRAEIKTKWKAYEKWFPANIEFMVASRTDPELRRHFTSAIGRYEKELLTLQEDSFKQNRLVMYVTSCFIRGLCLERLVNPPELVDEIFEEFVQILSIALAEKSDSQIQATSTL